MFWSLPVADLRPGSVLEYRYQVQSPDGGVRREPVFRRLAVTAAHQEVREYWLAPELPDGAFLRQAFAGVIFNPNKARVPVVQPGEPRRFRLTL